MGTVETNGDAMCTIGTNGDAIGSIETNEDETNRDAMGTIKTNGDGMGTIETNGDAMGTIKTNGVAMGTIETNGDAMGTIETNGAAMGTIETNGDAMGINKTNENGVIMAGNYGDESFAFEQQHEAEFPCVIPASCNWYSPSIISCWNGYCAVGGKNTVYILTLRKHPPVYEWDMMVSSKISVKVTALAILGKETNLEPSYPELMAVGLDDGLTRIIDTKSKRVVKEHRRHNSKITALSWSHMTPKTVLTGEIKGNLSIWDHDENSLQIWAPVQSQLLCLQMSPTRTALFVAGYQNGNILVGDSEKLTVLQTYKSHCDDVTSLSWCPVSREGEYSFLSASKDRTVRLWDATKEKPLKVLSLPKPSYGKKKNEPMRINFFLAALWLDEDHIISASQNGDLICWDSNGKNSTIGGAHERVIFTMCKDHLTNQFVTVSMDRQLIVWNGNSLSPVSRVPSHGGFVYSLSTSLNNPYTVAIGVGDNIIRILSINNANPGYEILNLWEGIKSKVTVLSLHPTYEGVVGYGTEDGHVGCYSTNSKKSDISFSYHKKVVYSLTWAPSYLCQDFSTENVKINCLYTVGGEGTVLMHKMGALNKEACDIGKLIKTHNDLVNCPSRSDIAWRFDYTYFVLGNADGTINLFKTATLKLICTVNCHRKSVNCMTWHYSYDKEGTFYSNWLASGSNDDVLCITDFTEAVSNNNNEPLGTELLQPSKKLFGHTERITRLVWNPHKNATLASSSFDGTVRIWDVEGSEILATFQGHLGRVYSVAWSYLNGDVLYSGGEDFTVRRWKISQVSKDVPISRKKRNKKKKKSDLQKDVNQATPNIDIIYAGADKLSEDVVDSPKDSDLQDMKVNNTPSVVDGDTPNAEKVAFSPEITVNIVPREAKSESQRRKKTRSLLKTAAAADGRNKEFMQEDCISLAKYLKACNEDESTCREKSGVDPTSEESIHLSLYATRADANSLLSTECRAHEENKAHDQVMLLEMWRNNIGGLLDKAVENSSMNDTLVALAPLGGYEMWKAAVLAYAEQLEGQKRPHTCAVYYLAAGEVYKAINVLKENGYLREALVMAKVQLGSDHPLVEELYLTRASKLTKECQFEQAAECFLAVGRVDDAITVLAKRGDASSFLTALKVADIYNVEKHFNNLLRHTTSALFLEQKWQILHELLPRYSKIDLIHFQAVAGELLVDHMFETDLVKSLHFAVENHNEYKHFTDQKLMFPSCVRNNALSLSSTPSFLMSLLYILEEFCNFNIETCADDFEHIDFQQLQYGQPRSAHLHGNELWSEVVNLILYGVVDLVKGDCTNCFKKWLSVFDLLDRSGYPYALLSLFDVLFPKHYGSFKEIIGLFCCSECDQACIGQSFSNFMAFKCCGVLYHMWYKLDEISHLKDNDSSLLKGTDNSVNKVGDSPGLKESDNNDIGLRESDNNVNKDVDNSCLKGSNNNVLGLSESDDNVIGLHRSEVKQNLCDDLLQNIIATSSYDIYCVQENVYVCLSFLSSLLLSGSHALYYTLESEIRCINEKLMELDIKKRINEHILTRKTTDTQNTVGTCVEGEKDIPTVVNELCSNMVNVVIKVENLSGVDVDAHSGLPGTTQGHLENEMLTAYLRRKKNDLSETLNSFPSHIKEYPFPQTIISSRILLSLCLSNKTSDKRMNSLCDSVMCWGRSYGIYPTSYIEKLMKRKIS